MSAPTAPAGVNKQRVGRYEIYAEISSGGMATVHLGRQLGHIGFSRTVAVKRLHPHVAREQEFVEMFLDEARLATRIQDPHVVPTLDVVAEGGELMLVMEYVHGEALSVLLTAASKRKERVDPRVAVSIGAGMLDGLHAAHEAKNERGEPLLIVHRDVSPQNVLVGADGVTRVFDFGIAKAADRLHITQDGSLKGKVAYMSPEQLENEPIDRRSDIWAASVVIWEMLTGKRLFVADSQAALVRMILTRDVPKVSSTGAPAALDRILEKGLAKDPKARFATAREMALALEDALASAPARQVAAWVERCASDALADRAKLLAEVDRVASEERPSGATRVEFKQALAADMLSDEDAPTEQTKKPFADDEAADVTKVKPAVVTPVEQTLVLPSGPPAARPTPTPKATVRMPEGALLPSVAIPPNALDVTRPNFTFPKAKLAEPSDTAARTDRHAKSTEDARQLRSQRIAAVVIVIALVFIVIGVFRLVSGSKAAATADPQGAPGTQATASGTLGEARPPPPVAQEENGAAQPPAGGPPAPPAGVIVGTPPSPASPPQPPPGATPPAGGAGKKGQGTTKPAAPAAPPAGASKKCTPLDFDYPACLKR
ncbi:MAG: serine/threonine protein kinase [Deltaproteobacteria bacterium]|nr:serine/threonine protein kinase [Deltaproteobacteria bacterium]